MISLHRPLSISPPLISSHLFSSNDIKRAVKVMSTHTAIDEEEFQANFLKHGIHSLNSHTIYFLNNVVCSSLPNLGHSNPNNYKTIIRAHILQALHYSSSFMAFKQTWKEVTKGPRPKDMQISTWSTTLQTIFSHTQPLLRRFTNSRYQNGVCF